MRPMNHVRSSMLIAVAGIAASAFGQITMEPIAATLRYEVALPGGPWSSSVTINPGDRVEWRAVVSYTGTQPVAALGRIYYQPILSNVDNTGTNTTIDQLGAWRNGGISGQGNSALQQGILPPSGFESGEDSSTFVNGYGRVGYAFTSRSTTAGSSGALVGHRHSAGSNSAPPGEHIRIAGSNVPNWYAPTIPQGTVIQNNGILWGVVSDNSSATSTWFLPGTQNLALFRQAFIASTDAPNGERTVTINSEAATLQRAGGSSGFDDTRFMTWAFPGEGGSTATQRAGVEYVPATIVIVPTPGVLGAIGMVGSGVVFVSRRKRS